MAIEFPALNLPAYNFDIKQEPGKIWIFDPFRKKYVSLTPEEWVRQNFMQFLLNERAFPLGLMAPEVSLMNHGVKLRCDLIVYKRNGTPCMVVECKAPDIKLTQAVFTQIWQYNMKLGLHFLIVTNGMSHYCCKMNAKKTAYDFMSYIPYYEEISNI